MVAASATAASGPAAGDASHANYTVVAGDNLSKIAQHCYGDARQWTRIFDANRDQLSDPDRIFPGQVLRIP
jgi:nucleoid-associated protein YgaU